MADNTGNNNYSLEAKNAKVAEVVTRDIQRWHEGTVRNILKAKNNPDNLSTLPIIFDEMIKKREEMLPAFIKKNIAIAEFRRDTVNGEVDESQRSTIGIKTAKALEEFEKDVNAAVKASKIEGLSGKALERQVDGAYEAVKKELPKGGLLEAVTNPIFDPEKGGYQKGGILGGLAGLVLGFLLGGGFEGGLMGIAVMVLGAFLGAVGGKKIADAMTPDAPVRTPEQSKAPVKEKEIEVVVTDPSKIVALDASGITTIYVDNAGKNVPVPPGVIPDKKAGLMQITLDSREVGNTAKVTSVAVANKDGVFDRNDKNEIMTFNFSADTATQLNINRYKSKDGVVDLSEEPIQASLKYLREKIELTKELLKNTPPAPTQEPTQEKIDIPKERDSKEYVKVNENTRRARELAGQTLNGVTIPPPGTSNIPTLAMGEVAQLSPKGR